LQKSEIGAGRIVSIVRREFPYLYLSSRRRFKVALRDEK